MIWSGRRRNWNAFKQKWKGSKHRSWAKRRRQKINSTLEQTLKTRAKLRMRETRWSRILSTFIVECHRIQIWRRRKFTERAHNYYWIKYIKKVMRSKNWTILLKQRQRACPDWWITRLTIWPIWTCKRCTRRANCASTTINSSPWRSLIESMRDHSCITRDQIELR